MADDLWPDPTKVHVDGDWQQHDNSVREKMCNEIDKVLRHAATRVSQARPPGDPDRLTHWALAHLISGLVQ